MRERWPREVWRRGEPVPSVSPSIPDGIRDVIGKRLNQLSESCAQALSVASVIGREFSFNGVASLLDHLPEDRMLEVLDEALAHHVLEGSPQASDRYQFTHVLIRETLYDELSAARRSRLHRRIGEVMEELYRSNLEPYLAQLAHHFTEASRSGGAGNAGLRPEPGSVFLVTRRSI